MPKKKILYLNFNFPITETKKPDRIIMNMDLNGSIISIESKVKINPEGIEYRQLLSIPLQRDEFLLSLIRM